MTKRQYRETYRALRDRLATREAGAAVARRLTAHPSYRDASVVMTYLSVGSEVDTFPLARDVLAAGKRLCVPVCPPGSKEMTAAFVDDLAELAPGRFGIPEPKRARPASPKAIDLVVTPGVAFDRRGYRIGYGGGFYDRFLPLLRPDAVRVGVCYGFSLTDSLPHDAFDVPMDWILTESETVDARRSAD